MGRLPWLLATIGQLFRRKLLDLAFDLLHPAHGGLAAVSISALQRRIARWAQTDTRRLKPPGWMIPSFGADRAVVPERRMWPPAELPLSCKWLATTEGAADSRITSGSPTIRPEPARRHFYG